jgi:hypothetical protein
MTDDTYPTGPANEHDTSPRDMGDTSAPDADSVPPRAPDDKAREDAGGILGEAVEVSGRLAGFGHAVAQRVRSTAGEATRQILESQAARNRRLKALAREPLPNLFDLHPDARLAPVRDLGLQTILVDQIRGTAVDGPAQRGSDFLPLPPFRSANWRARWERIRAAQQGLSILPPIDVLETADGSWVVDGHNRVAAALYAGQPDIDAVVKHVRLSGEEWADPVQGSMAAILADNVELRAAAAGQLTPGASLAGRLRDPASYPQPAHTDETADNPDRSDAEPEPRIAEGDEPAP